MSENEMKLRPLIGRLSICCCETTVAIALRCVSTIGDGAVTVSCSAAPARLMVSSRSTAEPISSTSPSRTCGAKSVSSAAAGTVPGGNAGNAKCPCPSVVCVRARPVSLFVTMTVTPRRIAFDGSYTTPVRSPVVARIWPCAADGQPANKAHQRLQSGIRLSLSIAGVYPHRCGLSASRFSCCDSVRVLTGIRARFEEPAGNSDTSQNG